jgi:hypothetical protein
MFLQILAEQAEHTLKLKDKCLNNLISWSTRKKSYFLFILAHRWLIINFLLRNSDSGWAFGGFETFRMYWKKICLWKADGTGSVLYLCNGPFWQMRKRKKRYESPPSYIRPALWNLALASSMICEVSVQRRGRNWLQRRIKHPLQLLRCSFFQTEPEQTAPDSPRTPPHTSVNANEPPAHHQPRITPGQAHITSRAQPSEANSRRKKALLPAKYSTSCTRSTSKKARRFISM